MRLILSVMIVFISFFRIPFAWSGLPPPPQPPVNNPHPPVTEFEKRAVTSAQQFVEILLKNNVSLPNEASAGPLLPTQTQTLACLKTPSCLKKDTALLRHVSDMLKNYGKILETRHAHVIPWSLENLNGKTKKGDEGDLEIQATKPGPLKTQASIPAEPEWTVRDSLKPGEYVVHMYTLFSSLPGQWHHLGVVMTNNAQGEPLLRYFYILPLATPSSGLPEGMVCRINWQTETPYYNKNAYRPARSLSPG